MKVLIRKKIFDNYKVKNYDHGNSITKLLEISGFPVEVWDYVEVRVDGGLVFREMWEYATPRESTTVAISIVPQGGDSGTEILKTAVTIAVAYYTGGATSGFSGALITAGATAATGLLLNSMFPPPNPFLTDDPGRTALNSITGQSNKADPYGVCIRNYGFNRIYPRVVAEPYTYYVGDDQYFIGLYDFGIGEQQLMEAGIRIGESNLIEYEEVDYNIAKNPGELVLYKDQVNTENFTVLFEDVGDNAIRVSDGTVESVDLKFDFPYGLTTIVGRKRINRETTVGLQIKVRPLGSNQWTDFSSYDFELEKNYINDNYTTFQALIKPDNIEVLESYNYSSYTFLETATKVRVSSSTDRVFIRVDLSDPATESRAPLVGDNLVIPGVMYGRREASIRIAEIVSSSEAFGVGEYEIRMQETYTYDQTITGDWAVFAINEGYLLETKITSAVDILRIKENTRNQFRFSVKINFNVEDTWEIWVNWVDLDIDSIGSSPQYINDFVWTGIVGYSKSTPIVSDLEHTYLELKIRASDQLNGNIGNLSAEVFSILDYYDPATLTWKQKATSNPAWVFVDLLTGTLNQRAISKDKIDVDSIVAWANYCESENITYQGNTIGFECNFVLDYAITIREILNQVCSVGRATLNIVDGRFGVAIDELRITPVQIFNQRNIKSMSVNREYTKTPDAISCTFIDPNSNWQKNEVIAYDDGKNSSNSDIIENIEMFACTSIAQAWRQGRYFLAQQKLRRNNLTIGVDFESLACSRGDMILVSHDVLKQGGLPTRVLDISGNEITLDEPISDQGGSYILRSRIRATDTIEDLTVTSFVDVNIVEVSSVSGLQVDDLVIFGESATATREYIVKSIEFSDEFDARLDLIEHAPDIYTADSGDIPDYEVITQSDPLAGGTYPGAVTDMAVNYTINCHSSEKRYVYIESISWEAPVGNAIDVYEVYVEVNGQQTLVGFTKNKNYSYEVSVLNLDTVHTFTVIAVDGAGRKMPLQNATSITGTPIGDTTSPGDVLEFNANVLTETVELDWRLVTDCDVDRYYIRYSPNTESASWAQSVRVASTGATQSSVQVPLRTGTYFIKARDWAGNYSVTSAFLKTQVPEILNIDYISNVNAPTWSGVYEDTELIGDNLKLASTDGDVTFINAIGNFYFSDIFDLGDVFTARLTSGIIASGYTGTSLMKNWDTLAVIDPIAGAFSDDDYDVGTYARVRNDVDVMTNWVPMASVDYLSFGSELNATPWSRFSAADFTGRIFQLKVQLEGNETQTISPIVESVDIVANWTDRVIEGRDILSGTVVLFDNAFVNIPSLQVTAQENIQNGDYYAITDKTSAGFTVQFYDSSDNPVSDRKYDWIAKGYGKKYTLEDINF